ncbi:MAG: DUF1517 domain-containing protein [Oscillatoriales cyanobacterium C42_A2020_001]|nr:DUF1517 domain-containing protein [Leptolyngbyaceae cyanobacterium C42_A2020_001]
MNYSLPSQTVQVTVGSEADARSSGGRSGGGSFRSSPSSSSSSSNSSSSSSSRSSSSSYSSPGSRSYSRPSDSYYRDRPNGTVVAPAPGASSSATEDTTTAAEVFWIIGLIVIGGIGITVLAMLIMIWADTRSGKQSANDLDNTTFTVSKVQVALLAQAHAVQTELTQLTSEIDTSSHEGLYQLLQESVLILLRNSENWSHVLANSETVKSTEAAEALFNQLSITERSKFSVETLTNVSGKVRQRNFKPDPEEDPASYIVVTLLVGTDHDNGLFNDIRTEGMLKEALQKLAAISPEYLLVFELLWSPQAITDSLTYDELLTEYTEMLQI